MWYYFERVAFAARRIAQFAESNISVDEWMFYKELVVLPVAMVAIALASRFLLGKYKNSAWLVVGNVGVSRDTVRARHTIFVVRPRIQSEGVAGLGGVYVALVEDVEKFCAACARAWGTKWVHLAGGVCVADDGLGSLKGVVAVDDERSSWIVENDILLVHHQADVSAIAAACSEWQ